MVGQAGVALGEHHRLAAAGEVFEHQNRHAISLAGVHLAQVGHHGHQAHLGLIGLLFEAAQTDGGKQAHGAAELFEGMVGKIEAEQFFFEL